MFSCFVLKDQILLSVQPHRHTLIWSIQALSSIFLVFYCATYMLQVIAFCLILNRSSFHGSFAPLWRSFIMKAMIYVIILLFNSFLTWRFLLEVIKEPNICRQSIKIHELVCLWMLGEQGFIYPHRQIHRSPTISSSYWGISFKVLPWICPSTKVLCEPGYSG